MANNEWASFAYNVYWIIAAIALAFVAIYALKHRRELAPIALLFSLGAGLNFAGDAASKVWFWLWRLLDKPAGMVDHPFVVAVTLIAAVGILLAVRFWTFAEYGEKGWIVAAACALGGAWLLHVVGL